MQYSKGAKPATTIDRDLIMAENEADELLFNGDSGIYTYEGKHYLIGDGVFLAYTDLSVAKADWFGQSEEEMWAQIREEGEFIDSFVDDETTLYEDYYCEGLYYRVHHQGEKNVECSHQGWDSMEEIAMMSLPSLPGDLLSFEFPVMQDEHTEIYFDEDLFNWFLDRGDIRKTLFSSVEEGTIPWVRYIVKLEEDFFIATPSEYSIEGRFFSVEEVLLVVDYATIGKHSYEEIDYVKACLLDREANDEEVDYIADKGLYWWFKMNVPFEGNYVQKEGENQGNSYDIYRLLDGFFVLDAYQRSVMGKYTSFESAYNGAKEEYEESDDEDDYDYDDDHYDDEDTEA